MALTTLRNTLDTAMQIETPEGTLIEVRPAGLYVRGLAFLIDELLRWTIILGCFALAGFIGKFGEGLVLIVLFVTYWLYGVIFEVLNNGITPGKKVHRVQVVHDDGTPIRLPSSVLRNLLLAVDLLPIFYITGICTMMLSEKFQRLGDLAAGTIVIYRPQSAIVAQSQPTAELGAQVSPVSLNDNEQSVLVDFLERSGDLSVERVDELAGLVSEALHVRGDLADGVKRIANGFRGVSK